MFCALGASGFVPITHAAIFEGVEGLKLFPLLHILITISCYLTGVVFYVTRFPESRWSETFDVWVS